MSDFEGYEIWDGDTIGACEHNWHIDRRQDALEGTRVVRDGFIRFACSECGRLAAWMQDPLADWGELPQGGTNG